MRRIIKPFTVEVRGKRRSALPEPDPSEQPVVDWPASMFEDPQDSPSRPDPQDPQDPAGHPDEPDPVRPVGRVLLALDEARPPPAEIVPADEDDAPAPETAPPFEPETLPPLPATAAAAAEMADPLPVAADTPPQVRRARLPRTDFARGERWKARLPAAVHRTAKKRHR